MDRGSKQAGRKLTIIIVIIIIIIITIPIIPIILIIINITDYHSHHHHCRCRRIYQPNFAFKPSHEMTQQLSVGTQSMTRPPLSPCIVVVVRTWKLRYELCRRLGATMPMPWWWWCCCCCCWWRRSRRWLRRSLRCERSFPPLLTSLSASTNAPLPPTPPPRLLVSTLAPSSLR